MFNIGDRVIHNFFGAGVIQESTLCYGVTVYIVVFDKPNCILCNWGFNNLPANRCGRFYEGYLDKEVQDEV